MVEAKRKRHEAVRALDHCDWMIDPDLKRLRRPLTKVRGTFPRERSGSGVQNRHQKDQCWLWGGHFGPSGASVPLR